MRKKLLSLFLAFGMVSACFSGCGTEGSENTESKGQSGKEQEIESETDNEDSIYPDYLNLESARPMVKDGEEITLSVLTLRGAGATSDINDQWFVKFLEEKMNVKLEIEEVTYDTASDKLNLMFASNELPDILFYAEFGNSDVLKYGVEEEMLLPISDYFSEELTPNILATLSDYPDIADIYTAPNGKMYTLPSIAWNDPGLGNTVGKTFLLYNKEYLSAVGIESQEELPTTLDEFTDLLRKFQEMDPAVMGVDEIYPLLVNAGLDTYTMPACYGWVPTGSYLKPTWDVNKEEVVIPCMEENYAEYLKYYNMLYTEGLIHKDFYTIDVATQRALIAEGKCPVVYDYAPSTFGGLSGDWYVAAPLTSEYCDIPVVAQGDVFYNPYTFISADTEYPELCVRILDYLYSDEGSLYENYGPMAGSDDTMGLVDGFTVSEEAGIQTPTSDYSLNQIQIAQCAPINQTRMMDYAYELAGMERKVMREVEDAINEDWAYLLEKYKIQQGAIQKTLPAVYLDSDANEKLTDLSSVIGDHVKAETAKFVTGIRALDEIDDFFEELKELGGEEYRQIYLDAYKDYVR